MTIPRLQGVGDELMGILPQLGQNIMSLANPNWQLQRALPSLMAQNPQLAQQLADLEAQAPGTLGKMGFGNMANTIGQLGPSFGFQEQQEKRTAVNNLDPQGRIERNAGLTGTRTPNQRRAEQQALTQGDQQIGLNTQTAQLNDLNLNRGQLQFKNEQEEAAQQEIWKSYTPTIHQIMDKHNGNLFQAMRAGDLAGDALNAAYNLPQFSKILEGQRVDYWNEEGNALRRRQLSQADADLEYRKSRTSDKTISSELAQRFHGETAQLIASRGGGADFQQVYDLLSNPELRNDPRYQSAAAAIDDYRAGLGKKDYKDVMIRWENQSEIFDRVIMDRKAGDSMRQQAIEQKNEAAKRVFGAFGLEAPQWGFDDAWYRPGKVKLEYAPNWMEQFGFDVGTKKTAEEDRKTAADTTGTRQSPDSIVTPKPGAGGSVKTSSVEERKSGKGSAIGNTVGKVVDFVDHATRPDSGPVKPDSVAKPAAAKPNADPKLERWRKLKQDDPEDYERRLKQQPANVQEAIRKAIGG